MRHIPIECITYIMHWFWEFERREALDRAAAFRVSPLAATWSTVPTSIRELTPRYRITWASLSQPSPLVVFSPDCNPWLLYECSGTIRRQLGFTDR